VNTTPLRSNDIVFLSSSMDDSRLLNFENSVEDISHEEHIHITLFTIVAEIRMSSCSNLVFFIFQHNTSRTILSICDYCTW